MPGEEMHQKGADGARRAKRWLDATTRTRASWTNEEKVNAGRLEYDWPHGGQPFSFDVGGLLIGEPFENHGFAAEVKNYTSPNLGDDYDDFLAKCFVVQRGFAKDVHQFMFLTWHPFRVTSWTQLRDKEAIKRGIRKNAHRVYDIAADPKRKAEVEAAVEAAMAPDASVIDELADRLWLVVLSDKQEQLLISDSDRKIIVAHRVDQGLL